MKTFILFFILIINISFSKEVYIAVSSNFLNTLQIISLDFEKQNNCKIIISSDSTVNLYNKIKLGIPFDIFISADSYFPKLLENNNDKCYVYAYGKLVFFKNNFFFKKNFFLNFKYFKHISISNPKLSPYGYSSNSIFNNLKIKNNFFIFGSNINQAFSFVYNNSSDFGIVALSQIIQTNVNRLFIWKVPKYLSENIEQGLIILKNSKNRELAENFLEYIKTKNIISVIKNNGYKTIE